MDNDLAARYPDLLGDRADPALARLVSDLDALYSGAPVPARLRAGFPIESPDRAAGRRARAALAGRLPIPRLPATATARPAGPARRGPWRRLFAGTHAALAGAAYVALLVAVTGALLVLLRGGGGAGPGGGALHAGAPVKSASPAASPERDPCQDARTVGVESFVACVMAYDPGLAWADAAGLVQHLDQSRASDGYTLTIWRAYADANRVAIAYTLTTPRGFPADARLTPGATTLTDDAGRTYQGNGGYGDVESGTRVSVLTFDAAPLPAGATEARFHLAIAGLQVFTPPSKDQPTPQVIATDEQGRAVAVKVAPGTPVATRVAGPWAFDLTVPVAPSRTVEVNQAVTARPAVRYIDQSGSPVATPAGGQPAPAAGVQIDLQRVVIAPSEMRVYLRFTPPPGVPGFDWAPIVHVGGADGSWDSRRGASGGTSGQRLADGTYVYVFNSPFYDRRGDWVLTVDELVGFTQDPRAYDPSKRDEQIRLAGPWVFRFAAP
ncbi:MAG TPA: DUF4179 domain-containing protein [Thermomicrobiales bacterium]|nr:DUF4179 domain-containing protein [Thermomicrobiales bacterium]